ncbi:hypothetical protein [Vreelandella neptunia]|uniref:Uncharacterized protein n=1 Tax=Vreelandella neptunia TaxID=115551 RepID=A0ABS9S6X3_9GAMM|nr:hypothetical protein [Halomonas neptunia]MCH4811854.1 hypothetical protein [Halomonas neptunia]
MLAMAEGVVGVGTARNMLVPVAVEVLETAPPALLERFDHVVEGSLEVSNGTLVIAGCTDYLPDAARLPIAKGGYAVSVCASGLGTHFPRMACRAKIITWFSYGQSHWMRYC